MKIDKYFRLHGNKDEIVFEEVEEELRPVVRGEWNPRDLTFGRSFYYCSVCEMTVDMPTAMGVPMFRYCPNCGAEMVTDCHQLEEG